MRLAIHTLGILLSWKHAHPRSMLYHPTLAVAIFCEEQVWKEQDLNDQALIEILHCIWYGIILKM